MPEQDSLTDIEQRGIAIIQYQYIAPASTGWGVTADPVSYNGGPAPKAFKDSCGSLGREVAYQKLFGRDNVDVPSAILNALNGAEGSEPFTGFNKGLVQACTQAAHLAAKGNWASNSLPALYAVTRGTQDLREAFLSGFSSGIERAADNGHFRRIPGEPPGENLVALVNFAKSDPKVWQALIKNRGPKFRQAMVKGIAGEFAYNRKANVQAIVPVPV